MELDPYEGLAELLRGTVTLIEYYSHKMKDPPRSLEPATNALLHAIRDLEAHADPELPG